MARMAGQAPAHTDLAWEAVDQVPVFKDKVVKGALTSSPTRVISSSSQGIRAI